MAEVVDDVEIEMVGTSKKNRVFVANISDECIIGLDTMKMFGRFSAVKHVMDTKDARPVKQRPCRTPLAFKGE